jgi:PKD repeat protein
VIGALGARGGSGSGGSLQVSQTSQGQVRVEASCAGGSGSVDFGDGTSTPLSGTTGPITHTYSSAGPHQATLTCTGGPGQSSSVGTATVGGAAAGATARARPAGCLRIPPGVLPDALDRVLMRLGVGVCRR